MKPRAISIAAEVPRRRALEKATVLPGTRTRLLAGSAAVGRGGRSWAVGGTRRRRVAGLIVIAAIVVAGLVGALFGSGLYSAEGRFGAERLAAQAGKTNLRGLPDLPGHPATRAAFDRKDVIRQIMALDGVQ